MITRNTNFIITNVRESIPSHYKIKSPPLNHGNQWIPFTDWLTPGQFGPVTMEGRMDLP